MFVPAARGESTTSNCSIAPPEHVGGRFKTNRTVEALEDDFVCLFCCKIVDDPVTAGCHHMYCRGCVEWKCSLPGRGGCAPCKSRNCGAQLAVAAVRPVSPEITEELDQLMLYCRYRNGGEGCIEELPLSQMAHHESQCPYAPQPLNPIDEASLPALVPFYMSPPASRGVSGLPPGLSPLASRESSHARPVGAPLASPAPPTSIADGIADPAARLAALEQERDRLLAERDAAVEDRQRAEQQAQQLFHHHMHLYSAFLASQLGTPLDSLEPFKAAHAAGVGGDPLFHLTLHSTMRLRTALSEAPTTALLPSIPDRQPASASGHACGAQGATRILVSPPLCVDPAHRPPAPAAPLPVAPGVLEDGGQYEEPPELMGEEWGGHAGGYGGIEHEFEEVPEPPTLPPGEVNSAGSQQSDIGSWHVLKNGEGATSLPGPAGSSGSGSPAGAAGAAGATAPHSPEDDVPPPPPPPPVVEEEPEWDDATRELWTSLAEQLRDLLAAKGNALPRNTKGGPGTWLSLAALEREKSLCQKLRDAVGKPTATGASLANALKSRLQRANAALVVSDSALHWVPADLTRQECLQLMAGAVEQVFADNASKANSSGGRLAAKVLTTSSHFKAMKHLRTPGRLDAVSKELEGRELDEALGGRLHLTKSSQQPGAELMVALAAPALRRTAPVVTRPGATQAQVDEYLKHGVKADNVAYNWNAITQNVPLHLPGIKREPKAPATLFRYHFATKLANFLRTNLSVVDKFQCRPLVGDAPPGLNVAPLDFRCLEASVLDYSQGGRIFGESDWKFFRGPGWVIRCKYSWHQVVEQDLVVTTRCSAKELRLIVNHVVHTFRTFQSNSGLLYLDLETCDRMFHRSMAEDQQLRRAVNDNNRLE